MNRCPTGSRSPAARHYKFFFFSSRRRHTRFKCDWSSDVCSSDLVARVGREDALDDGDAAQRLGSKAYPLPASPGNYLADVLVEQVEIEVGEGHGMAVEDFLVVGVVVRARVYGCARLMYRNGAARRISRRGFVLLSSFQFLIPHGRSFLLACASL